MTDTEQLQLDYWTQFHAMFRQHSDLHITPNPHPCHWTEVRFGNPASILSLKMNTRPRQRQVAVQLVIEGPHRRQAFEDLYRDREEIEREIGQPLHWEEPSGTKEKVSLCWAGADPTDRESWPAQHAWLLETMQTFHRVLAPRL